MEDIPKNFILKCERCGAEFKTLYYKEGSIDHSNQTSSWNLEAAINRGEWKEELLKKDEKARKCATIWFTTEYPKIRKVNEIKNNIINDLRKET